MVTLAAVVKVPWAGVRMVSLGGVPPQSAPIRNATAKRDSARCRSRDTGSSAGGVACAERRLRSPDEPRSGWRTGVWSGRHARFWGRPAELPETGRRGGTIYTHPYRRVNNDLHPQGDPWDFRANGGEGRRPHHA